MTFRIHSLPHLTIDDRTVYARYNQFRRDFNAAQRYLKDTIRGNMKTTFEELIRLQIEAHRSVERAGHLITIETVPSIRTSRPQLEVLMGWCKKTCYNHIMRFIEIGLVTEKKITETSTNSSCG